ncbi:MAG: peptide-modifying radical SAM enzyme CbpB [Methanophagales archaeon ANME-1-THS]|nr:MAG: peptide-modifying radical SAM enzyme CbpB [Methanophagales archaeon ANME-1-THS]
MLCDIDEETLLAIDPDTVFWALVPKGADVNSKIMHDILPLYDRVKRECGEEMHDFRFKSNLAVIYMNSVSGCNLNCSYCYIPQEIRKNHQQMDKEQLFETLIKVCDYTEENGGNRKLTVVFHGSEPLLMKDEIYDAIEEFEDRLYFGIQTNGTLFREDDVEFLKKHGVSVGLSLDSPYPEIHNSMRKNRDGRGTFEKVVEAIEWFDGYQRLNVVMTVTKQNVSQLPEMVSFLHARKVPSVLLNPVRGTQGPARSLMPDYESLKDFFISALKRAEELTKKTGKQITVGNFANILVGIIAPTARKLMCDITPCGGGRCFFAIAADGDVFPCGEFIGIEEFRGGNIFRNFIPDIMNSDSFGRVRNRIVEKIEHCNSCAFRNICGAPCPAEVYTMQGNFYNPSPYCEFYEELIRFAFKIIAEDKVKYFLKEDALNTLGYQYRMME